MLCYAMLGWVDWMEKLGRCRILLRWNEGGRRGGGEMTWWRRFSGRGVVVVVHCAGDAISFSHHLS
jgi:hypothetical protein